MNPYLLLLITWILEEKHLEEEDVNEILLRIHQDDSSLLDIDFVKTVLFGNRNDYLEEIREIARANLREELRETYKEIRGIKWMNF